MTLSNIKQLAKKNVKLLLPKWLLNKYHNIRNPKPWIYKSLLPNKILIKEGAYVGKRCFIIGNGPSLAKMDISPLRHECTIAVNRGYLLKDKGLDHVTFYGISDKGAYADYGHEIPLGFAQHICLFGSIPWNGPRDQLNVMNMYAERYHSKYMSNGFFQFDLSRPVAHTYTVVLQMLQVAVYAGFKEIYIIGVDNNFSGKNMHFYQDTEQEKKNMEKWKLNPCDDNNKAFGQAFELLKKRGIHLANAGVDSSITTLPCVPYESLFYE